jgi:asparagine synthase (glutamine-hydrolysing)
MWVVFNGEIYNFQELRAQLAEKGHQFRTNTDTEVIVHLYEECGVDCVQKMRGMFSFAIWDSIKQQLFIARDRLGKKPLAYAQQSGAFIFGSEIKAIIASGMLSLQPDYHSIDTFLTYHYVPSPFTAFSGIHKLPPAHFLTVARDGTLTVQRYWQPPIGRVSSAPRAEIQAELLGRLQEAVALRMVSDVPLGAFLSGGIDSSAIVALMSRASGSPVKTFSIGFEDRHVSELPSARLVARRYRTDHHECILRPDAIDILPLLIHHYDEPFADPSAIPTYYVSKITREHVTVALSGDGGDEIFCGYLKYQTLNRMARWDRVPRPLRSIPAMALAWLSSRVPGPNWLARAARLSGMLAADLPERYVTYHSTLKREEKKAGYTPAFAALLHGRPLAEPLVGRSSYENTDPLAWMMWHDLHRYLPDCLMVKSDIAAMANSLEVRCPLLDHKLVEFAASIPSAMKLGPAGGKDILKDTMREMLPPEILDKPKTGFGMPLKDWFRGDLREVLRATLLDDRAIRRGLFKADWLRRLVTEQITGRRDWSNRLWALLMLELWFRSFFD